MGMIQISNFVEAELALKKYIPAVKEMTGQDITLDRMLPLMQLLGNPEAKLKIIHIAGTSGKTSTAYYVASLLKTAGQKVGLTVSPHMDSIAERVQIDLQPLKEKEFCSCLYEFLELINDLHPQPTYFELLMAYGYWYFVRAKVDYAVIETGLGGLHDASNVAIRADKVCILTDIGYDHMHVLGYSLPEISKQKAGIMHTGNQAIYYTQSSEINEVFESWAHDHDSRLKQFNETNLRQMPLPPAFQRLPPYQQRNWLLANQAYKFVADRDNLPILSPQELAKSMAVQVPGRMDTMIVHDKTLVMDGAHNAQKMETFVKSFQAMHYHKTAAILLSLKHDKDYEQVLALLKPICSHLIVTSLSIGQDYPLKAVKPDELARAAKKHCFKNITVEPRPEMAYKILFEQPNDLLVVTGSLYLLGYIRTLLHNDK